MDEDAVKRAEQAAGTAGTVAGAMAGARILAAVNTSSRILERS